MSHWVSSRTEDELDNPIERLRLLGENDDRAPGRRRHLPRRLTRRE